MTISVTGTDALLGENWTLRGVSYSLDSLAHALQQLPFCRDKNLRIDCGQMKEADIGGLQVLNVWLQCAKFRGMAPILVNIPKNMQHVMQVLIGNGYNPDPAPLGR